MTWRPCTQVRSGSVEPSAGATVPSFLVRVVGAALFEGGLRARHLAGGRGRHRADYGVFCLAAGVFQIGRGLEAGS